MAITEFASRAASAALTPPLRRPGVSASVLPRTWARGFVWLVLSAIAVSIPLWSTRYVMTICVAVTFAVIGSIAMNLILGVAGQASIGSAAFMAIGAFAAAKFALDFKLPFILTLIASGVFAGIVGVLIGIPAMRVRGLYLVIATLALHYVALYVLARYQAAKVGAAQFLMPRVRIGDMPNINVWYYLMLAAAVASVLIMRNLLKTRYGRAWQALARDEIAAEVLGTNVRFQKVVVFGFTSMLIGFQGALFAYYLGVVSSDSFTFDTAVSYVAMVIIGGHASVGGSVLGAAFVVAIPYIVTQISTVVPDQWVTILTTRLFDIETIVYGVSIVVFLIVEPRGLIYLWNRAVGYFSAWPLSQQMAGAVLED